MKERLMREREREREREKEKRKRKVGYKNREQTKGA